MRPWLGIAAAATGLAFLASAHAQDASEAHLLTTPDAASMSDHFPVVALARGESGRAVLSCAVAADGSSQCTSTSETPANAGFGAAAVALSQGWRFTPSLQNGQPVASTVRIPVAFQNPSPVMSPIAPDINVDATRNGATRLTTGGSDLGRFYPPQARQSARGGRALVACAVRTNRQLECGLERETPEGQGFGAAAVSAAQSALSGQTLRPGDRTRVAVDFAVHYEGSPPAPRHFWEAQPTPQEYMRFYPGRALDAQRGGRALLNCEIQTDRSLACTTASESPSGWGFGDGALQLARRYRLSPGELGRPGHSAGDHIILPMVFALPQ